MFRIRSRRNLTADLTQWRVMVTWIVEQVIGPLARVGNAAMRDVRLWMRLVVALLVVVVPIGTFLVTLMVQERNDALHASRERLGALARLAAEQEDDALQEAANLVRILGKVPDVTNGVPGRCHEIVRELVNEHPRIGMILVTQPGGLVTCDSGNPVPTGLSVSDRAWYRQAISPDAPDIIMSDLITSRATGQLTVVVATPTRSPIGSEAGTVSAGLNLAWFTEVGRRLGDETNSVVTVVSLQSGSVLARSAAADSWMGRFQPDRALLDDVRRNGSGIYEDDGDGGRIHGFARLPGMGGSQAAVLVSQRRVDVTQAANGHLRASLALLSAVFLGAMMASAAMAQSLVVRPLRILVSAAGKLGRGELQEALPLASIRGQEFRALASAINDAARQRNEREATLSRLAALDGLTGVANRRAFDAALRQVWMRRDEAVGLVMVDVDHFKLFNDCYGHQEGDAALRLVGQILGTTSRRLQDLVARYGGEEFVLLTSELGFDGVHAIGERVVSAVRSLKIPHSASPSGFLTASVGVVWTAVPDSSQEWESFLRAADDALYEAKRTGRDRCVVSLAIDHRVESVANRMPTSELDRVIPL